tara:strand:+ start:10610 stop:11203 length:594 start_codon:yes stop_codon:yes gene_type:complete
MKNTFEKLSSINVNEHVENKNGLTYLSWAWAWSETKKTCPDATYTIYENADGLCYHHDGKTAWVKTGVTIGDIELIEYLPVMDYRNKSITIDKITSFDVNKSIQRSLTKAIARHGLGLYIYAGEDLPESESKASNPSKKSNKKATEKASLDLGDDKWEDCLKYVVDNKHLGFDGVVKRLKQKYELTSEAIKTIKTYV